MAIVMTRESPQRLRAFWDTDLEPDHPFATLLLATDLTPASAEATTRAIELAVALGARLLVMNVVQPARGAADGPRRRLDQARSESEAALMEIVRRARAAGACAEFLVWDGDPAASLLSAAEAEGADLLIVGTRGRSTAGRLLLGSVSDHLVHHASCPVMVVRPRSGSVVTTG
jgi:nucleotide-binding universal stress UspA family protein